TQLWQACVPPVPWGMPTPSCPDARVVVRGRSCRNGLGVATTTQSGRGRAGGADESAPDSGAGTEGKHEEGNHGTPCPAARGTRLTLERQAMSVGKKYDLLIKNARIVRPRAPTVEQGDIAIAGGKIAQVGGRIADSEAGEVMEANNQLAFPG